MFPHFNLFHSPSSLTLVHTHTHTHIVPILQSFLSLLLFKLMFGVASQCIPTVDILTLVCLILFITLPYPFTSHAPFSTAFNTCPYMLYLPRGYVLQYY
jgi:hypothetical protein